MRPWSNPRVLQMFRYRLACHTTGSSRSLEKFRATVGVQLLSETCTHACKHSALEFTCTRLLMFSPVTGSGRSFTKCRPTPPAGCSSWASWASPSPSSPLFPSAESSIVAVILLVVRVLIGIVVGTLWLVLGEWVPLATWTVGLWAP